MELKGNVLKLKGFGSVVWGMEALEGFGMWRVDDGMELRGLSQLVGAWRSVVNMIWSLMLCCV
jgi:hypothetical protein